MDLHLTEDQATIAEKAAVDSVLGPPESGWEGGPRSQLDGRTSFAISIRRDLLLPVLHSIQARAGWISPGALNYVALRMNLPPAEIYGVASFYAMFSLSPRPPIVAHVCDDIACLARGAGALCEELEEKLGGAGSPDVQNRATWLRSPCLGLCERAPAAIISVAGETPREFVVAPATSNSIQSALHDAEMGRLSPEPDTLDVRISVPNSDGPQLRLLRRIGKMNPSSLDDYRRLGGYEALRSRDRDGAGRNRPRSDRIAPAGPRRRCFPHRKKMGSSFAAARLRPSSLRRLQCRRIRARHVQGPRPDGRRSVCNSGRHDHCRIGRRRRERVHLYPRRISLGCRALGARNKAARRKDFSVHKSSVLRFNSTSNSAAVPEPTSAVKKQRSSIRSKAIAASRATSLPSPRKRASSISPPS